MAVYLANTGVLTVNAVDLSTLVSSVTINRSFDELEVTLLELKMTLFESLTFSMPQASFSM